MILYSRTNWYGIGYFFTLTGSVWPKVVPAQIFSCALCILVHGGHLDSWFDAPQRDWFGETYAMQVEALRFEPPWPPSSCSPCSPRPCEYPHATFPAA